MPLGILSLRTPRESENSPEQTAQLLASLARATKLPKFHERLQGKQPTFLSLEITLVNNQITFAVVAPKANLSFVHSQVLATYPDCIISPIADYLGTWTPLDQVPHLALIRQTAPAYFPLRDYADYRQVDPMLPLLGVLSKAGPQDRILIQFILMPPSSQVLSLANKYIVPQFEYDPTGKPIRELAPEGKLIVKDKLSHPLVNVSLRFATSHPGIIPDLLGAISVLNRPDGNSLAPAKLYSWDKSRLWHNILHRIPTKTFGSPNLTFNVMELSSLWHLPGLQTKLPNIAWAASVAPTEAPSNLPIFDTKEAKSINYFAKTQFKNAPTTFGLKLEDRLRHVYILGKSGTGKSTLLENMAIDDFKKDKGVAFIDPHGDSINNLLNYIPSHRVNDTIYFNPADRDQPITLNILETANPEQSELVVSGIIAIFHKLYGKFWGPRMQYIFRNALLTLVEIPNSTLPDVVKILSDLAFRQSIYLHIKNQALLSFWQKEFDTLEDDVRLQYTYPILNKVGQFVNSPLIQQVISSPKSSIDLTQVLNSGKIFLANLSQGKLGEDNATLLGAIIITKLELAAMARIDTPTSERRDFFLYVDEFQNFATTSFIKIFSEARKFRLGLVVANQYIAQIPEDIQKAIFGNVGTLISFVLGSEDARVVSREFGETFDANSLVNLQKYQIAVKMTIDGTVSRPFTAETLPPFKSSNSGKAKVVAESKRRYAKKK